MNSKSLCVIAIDTSGSMLNRHGESEFRRIDVLNNILKRFINKIKQNPILVDKLDICIVEIKEKVKVVTKPTSINNIKLPLLKTVSNEEESIGLGIAVSIQEIKKWKKTYFWGDFFRQNYTPYLILITDQSHQYLLDEEKTYPFKNQIQQLAQKKYLKFYGIGVGEAELVDFFNTNVVKVTNNPNFEAIFKDLEYDLSKDLNEKRPLKEEVALANKYFTLLIPFLRKYFKLLSLIFAISISIPISLCAIKIEGIKIEIDKLIEININEIKNYETNFPDNNINININSETDWIGGDSDLKFVYEFKEKIDDYNLGAYSHNSSQKVWQSSRILLKNLYDIQSRFKINGKVYIKITGETDAVPVSNLIYKGEFGNLKDKIFYKNRAWFKISKNNEDKINDNNELAFLRGYAIWDLIRRNFDFVIRQPTQYQQVVKVNDNTSKIGGTYRRVIVEMIFYDIIDSTPWWKNG
jgi:uncharacterized protein YegL